MQHGSRPVSPAADSKGTGTAALLLTHEVQASLRATGSNFKWVQGNIFLLFVCGTDSS